MFYCEFENFTEQLCINSSEMNTNYNLKQTNSFKIFERLSSIYTDWSILEYFITNNVWGKVTQR